MLIKICGITDVKEAEYVDNSPADFAGLVMFYKKSKRNNDIETAGKILSVFKNTKTVAVTVSPTLEQIKVIEAMGFDYIQIHGYIELRLLRMIRIPVIKAFNVDDIASYIIYSAENNVAGYVFDAAEPGSGKAFDWSMLKDMPRNDKMFILAGGLTPENVKHAIAVVKPDGVDVSSGVENDDGAGKNFQKIDKFCKEARNI